ncbi:MAG: PhoU domain-containing protein [Thermoplasmata archaeon]
MEVRKIQKTGGSTLVVSLPKIWCQNFNLKVGSKVSLNYSERGAIILEPFEKSKDNTSSTVELKSTDNLDNDMRILISKYIQGAKKITIKSKSKSSLDYIINKFLELTIGFEVIEENENEAILEDIISLPTLTFEKALKRMDTLVRSIVRESISEQKISKEYVAKKENEVDKFNIYIQRLFNQSLKDYSVLQLNKISTEEALAFLLVSRILERIADHGVRIYYIAEGEILKKSELLKFVDQAIQILEQTMEYYFKKDIEGANNLISKKDYFRIERNNLGSGIAGTEDDLKVAEILEDAERIAFYSTDICELIIDYFQ